MEMPTVDVAVATWVAEHNAFPGGARDPYNSATTSEPQIKMLALHHLETKRLDALMRRGMRLMFERPEIFRLLLSRVARI